MIQQDQQQQFDFTVWICKTLDTFNMVKIPGLMKWLKSAHIESYFDNGNLPWEPIQMMTQLERDLYVYDKDGHCGTSK